MNKNYLYVSLFVLFTLSGACTQQEEQVAASIAPVVASPNNGVKSIVIYGASGKIGGLIVQQALERGHSVVGVSRDLSRLTLKHERFRAMQGDVTDVESVRSVTAGADVVAVSVAGSGAGNLPGNAVHARAAVVMVEAFSDMANAPHVIQLGGATTMFDTMEAMEEGLSNPAKEGTPMHGMLFGHLVALNVYRSSTIPWTIVTPPMTILGWTPDGIIDGSTTLDSYRTSTTEFVSDQDGKNEIYVLDLAKAVVDEAENAAFIGQRFTLGY
ncbi:MAG: NAD(P)H-binding protein [Proteobacteria bacterium]|nr:NAD(P)H-binding protein [Pseudomonadota bacterium]